MIERDTVDHLGDRIFSRARRIQDLDESVYTTFWKILSLIEYICLQLFTQNVYAWFCKDMGEIDLIFRENKFTSLLCHPML